TSAWRHRARATALVRESSSETSMEGRVSSAPLCTARRVGRLLHLGETGHLADLGDLTRVIVPVVIEHGADVHGNRDLVGPHELLEQRDASLPLELSVAQGVEITEDLLALRVELFDEILERPLLARRRHL